MAKKYIDNEKKDKRSGSGELFGIALIVVSAFFLLCIIVPIILGTISQAIRGVVLGVFGIFAYPLFLGMLVLGIALVRDFGLNIGLKNGICIGITTFCLFMILQLATSFMYIGEGFSHYISSVFDAKYTGGGVLFGVLVYGLQAAVGQVFTYILMSLVLVIGVLVMLNVFSKLRGKKAQEPQPEAPKGFSFEKSDRPARAVKPIADNGLFVGTIVKPQNAIDTYGGNAMNMPPSQPQQRDGYADSNYYFDNNMRGTYANPYDSNRSESPRDDIYSQPVAPNNGLINNNNGGSAQFIKYNNNDRPLSAYEQLFGKTGKPGGISSGFSGFGMSSGTSSPLTGSMSYGLTSLAFPDEPSSSPVATPTQTFAPPEVKIEPKRPPKILHPEVVFPDPKDISDKIVGGEIFDGEEISQKMAEDAAAKEEPKAQEPIKTGDYAKFDFDNKRVQPTTFPPIERREPVSVQPTSPAPKEERSEIINGDYYAKTRHSEALGVNGVPPFVDGKDGTETDSATASAPRSTGLTLEIPEVVIDTSPEPKEVELAPIVNGEDVKSTRSLEELLAYEREIREREYSGSQAETAEPKDTQVSQPIPEIKREPEQTFVQSVAPKTPEQPVHEFSITLPEQEKMLEQELKTEQEQPADTVEIPPAVSGSFNYSDEVEDLSEKSFSADKDNTGYYVKEDTPESISRDMREEEKPEPVTIEPPVNVKPKTQLSLDDIMKADPDSLPKPKPKKKRTRYVPPPSELLVSMSDDPSIFSGNAQENAKILEATLESLKFPAKVSGITSGPAVTRYELEVPPGMSVRRIDNFSSDIAYNLASNGAIRIETPIPGKRAVGIEVPNSRIATVALRDLIGCKEFQSAASPVTFAIGKDIAGENIICNLEKMPHLLIAGATGSGKSACLNSIIISILYKSSPDDVRLILIDPKEVEFRVYQDMPHLLMKSIINDTDQAIRAFKWAKNEMDRRYKLLSKYCVRNIQEFNNSSYVKDGVEEKLPRIVVIVDELCELMMSSNRKDLEDKIMSMAQKARAAGLHLILATQRPSVDVITGTIKANLPSRIAFSVTSFNDSRTILDQGGAEALLGKGDMLYAPADYPQPKRVQGAFITTEEVTSIVEFVKEHNQADYDETVEELIMTAEPAPGETSSGDDDEEDEYDPLIKDVCRRVIETGQASTSMIQRRFSVGYARASRIIDQMENRKFIGPLESTNKPREVYITAEQFRETFGEDV